MPDFELEPERYELRESPAWQFEVTRREFAATGLLVCVLARSADGAKTESRIHIAKDGKVTLYTGKVEFGQGARTELAMAAAEELRVPLDRVEVVMADTSLVPDDGITAGSRTTPSTVPAVRAAAAAARQATELTAASDWKTLGTPRHPINGKEIVTGAHRYPSDIRRPGMLYGAVLRAPAYNTTLQSADLSAAEKMPGVTAVSDSGFVACAAPTSYAARKAVEAIAAKWETKEHPSSANLFAHLKAHPKQTPRVNARGSVEQGLAAAKRKLRSVFQVPFIQHAPMEPRAAVAEWNEGRLTVWTATQNPFGVRNQLTQAFRLPAEHVRVIVPDSGGGFGGKHTGEVAIEAARLAKSAGKPVSLRWTRAEEFLWAYFRPAGLFEIEAGIDEAGLLTAWDFTNYNAGTAAIESPYRLANSRTRFVYCESPLREGSYRGIAATANTFARECFMDELAEAAGKDPLEFRLANIENPRLRDVLQAAADRFGWRDRRGDKGVGLAAGTEKGSYVAACVELKAVPGAIRIQRFTMAYECGAILNPANLRSQVEGSIIQGLGGALTEAIEFENGRLRNGSFAKYRVPRFRDVPPLDIHLLDRKDLPPVGAGETPIIAVAPAIANALYRATGQRVKTMPVRPPA